MSDLRDAGDAWVTAEDGGRYWGRFGAAGLLAYDRDRDAILLQHRVTWSDHGDTWGIPGGARHERESAIDAAIRESQEEAGVPDDAVTPRLTHVLDRGGWTYTTLVADVATQFEPEITDPESHALAWVPLDEVDRLPLHPAFAHSWTLLRPLLGRTPVVVVDSANVVGSVPDGWWRDRHAAAIRLRDRIDAFVATGSGIRAGFFGLPDTVVPGLVDAFPEWIMVVEGVARGIGDTERVTVVDAEGLGDDEIVAEVERLAAANAAITVVTSDAELKARVLAAGAATTRGATKLLKRLPEVPGGAAQQ
ncbi:NUDIX hydrolase [Leucobacter luti]|uniref:ADP-ribose pyrophosphatase YjhB (NUDIX family) n=1 Tax=Leucobacter luti TaxID=340320 RepID=A0A4V6MDJ7_9MICO|nr:NUDIX hydrolase [Leucobacter luti]MBL3700853.1 NUDIX hydrolase [Leucobacter luti]RZT68309.1 ADP-ribose pyrophosphatase YjhB (NUDIX family) [Leucobacter luti]